VTDPVKLEDLTDLQRKALASLNLVEGKARFIPIPIGTPLLRMGLVQRSPKKGKRGYVFLAITQAGRDLIGS
jgi:hypothetical protein